MGMHWKRWERSPRGSDWGWRGRFWPRLAGRMSDFIQHRNPTHTPVPGALRPSRNQIPFGHLPGHQLLSPGSIILVPRVPASPQPNTRTHAHGAPHRANTRAEAPRAAKITQGELHRRSCHLPEHSNVPTGSWGGPCQVPRWDGMQQEGQRRIHRSQHRSVPAALGQEGHLQAARRGWD